MDASQAVMASFEGVRVGVLKNKKVWGELKPGTAFFKAAYDAPIVIGQKKVGTKTEIIKVYGDSAIVSTLKAGETVDICGSLFTEKFPTENGEREFQCVNASQIVKRSGLTGSYRKSQVNMGVSVLDAIENPWR